MMVAVGFHTAIEGTEMSFPLCFAVCLPGFGASPFSHSNNSNLCTGCLNGYYQPGGGTTCLACGAITPFVYPGKNELITTTATTKIGNLSAPGARSTDE
jgi:hypothetical protein